MSCAVCSHSSSTSKELLHVFNAPLQQNINMHIEHTEINIIHCVKSNEMQCYVGTT